MEKPLKIKLHVLSPIHIGCDDVYEPTSFVIDDKRQKLIEFDPLDFVKALNDSQRADFSKVCAGDNLLAVMKFIKNNANKVKGREIDITSEVIAHYKKILTMPTFDKRAVINQFTMNKTAYNLQTNQPYIPGTSLKGSIRTAYLSKLSVVTKTKDFWESCGLLRNQDLENPFYTYKRIGDKHIAKKLEQTLLNGDFASDPFRMVKVSDLFPVGDVKTKIVYAVNRKKTKSDKATLSEKGGAYQIFEAILPGVVFEGIINIDKPEDSSGIKLPITFDNLMASLGNFYPLLLETEIKVLKEIDISVPIINDINANFKEQINNKTAFLIRLGRHSGAEAVTIEGNRNIKIIQGQGKESKYLDHATTLWLAADNPRPSSNNGLFPFGWAVLEIVPFDSREGIYSTKKQTIINPPDTKPIEPEPPKKQPPVMISETITWTNAILVWTPGNQILRATKDNQKAELKVTDRSIVPEKHHETLFTKKKSVTANITVDKIGNAFKIISIS